jgi:hypothetical protein
MQDYDTQPYEYDDTTQGYDAPSLPYVPPASAEPEKPKQEDVPAIVPAQLPEESENPYADTDTVPYYAAPVPANGEIAPANVPPTQPILPPEEGTRLPVRSKRRRTLWFVLGGIAAAIVIAVASFALVMYLNRSTPMKTLDAFCNALQREDYQTAYNQLSQQLQDQIPESVLAAALSQDKVISCTHGVASESGDTSTTSLKLVHNSRGVNNDTVTLVKDKHSNWKIDNLQQA